jgi:glycosyltransferase involved in cell wall biosynthesis/GT2 family glycosyltransferase
VQVSVVINTYNRASTLGAALQSLDRQSFENFEVIVVNGPSTDGTHEVVASFGKRLKSANIKERNLSISRNVGIELSSGDIVAFLDDDAIADNYWLEELIAPFSNPEIGGTGGIVFDDTGRGLQTRFSACDRLGRTTFDVVPPFDRFQHNGANPFLYVQGTNMAFRRKALEQIGGFNKQCEYFYDEVEVCLRLTDCGWKLQPLDCARIHHKSAASHIRNANRIITNVLITAKNRLLFTFQSAPGHYAQSTIDQDVQNYISEVKSNAEYFCSSGTISRAERDRMIQDSTNALIIARQQAPIPRPFQRFSKPSAFVAFKCSTEISPMRLCFISQEYPPARGGGIGRFTVDMASELARSGHDVHVITRQAIDSASIDFEDGVWVHRIPSSSQMSPIWDTDPAKWVIAHNIDLYRELLALHNARPLDLVISPVWMAEGLFAALDQRWPTLIWLQTTTESAAAVQPSLIGGRLPTISALEAASISNASAVHAISQSILDVAKQQFKLPASQFVEHIGIQPPRFATSPSVTVENLLRAAENGPKILYVGRLEPRKGIDVFLNAIPIVAKARPDITFIIAGRIIPIDQLGGKSFRDIFVEQTDYLTLSKVAFLGEISDVDRDALYRSCDIFCAPSTFESFGLVVIEAMLHGLPCVVSDIPSFRELMLDGECGSFFESGNATDLAARTIALIEDSDKRAAMKIAAQQAFEKQFSIAKVAPRLIGHYRKIAIVEQRPPSDFPVALRAMLDGLNDGVQRNVDTLVADILRRTGNESTDTQMPILEEAPAEMHTTESIKDTPLDVTKPDDQHLTARPSVIQRARHKLRHEARRFLGRVHLDLIISTLQQLAADTQANRQMLQANTNQRFDELTGELGKRFAELTKELGKRFQEQTNLREEIVQQNLALMSEKLEFVRSEILYEIRYGENGNAPNVNSEMETKEPRILQPTKFEEFKTNGLRLNLGCGKVPLAGYINVDQRDVSGVDILADVGNLSLPEGSVREIFSAHLLEHFPNEQLRRRLLPYWFKLLSPHGLFRAIVPDGDAMLISVGAGEYSFEDFREVLFGGQEYSENYNYNLFTPASLRKLLEEAGFTEITIPVRGRHNGKFFEFEVRARRP